MKFEVTLKMTEATSLKGRRVENHRSSAAHYQLGDWLSWFQNAESRSKTLCSFVVVCVEGQGVCDGSHSFSRGGCGKEEIESIPKIKK